MGENIKVWFDEDNDILYISLRKGVAVDSEEVSGNIRVEYDAQDQIIGIEIYHISRMLAKNLAKELKETLK
jgi:YD repeat-containing protein